MFTDQPNHLMNHVVRPKAVMVRGQGSWVWDDHGKRYLDFIQGWAVNALGHAAPEVLRAVSEQAGTLVTASPAFHNARELELAGELARWTGLSRIFFTNSGAEANEGAIKLARKWGKVTRGGAFEIITTHNGFHGRTLATMAASGKPGWDAMFPPIVAGFVKVPFDDARAVAGAVGPKTAAILVEPVQGEAGVIVPKRGYLRALREIADAHGLLLMLDEIQTGIGRTGTLFAHQHDGVLPDVMTLGKGLGGGVPLAALVASERAARFEVGEQGGTFNGNPLATAAGIALLRTVTAPGFLEEVRQRGDELKSALERVAPEQIAEVRGKGLLLAARLSEPRAERIRDAAFDLGLLVNAPRPDVLRFMPALNVTSGEIAAMTDLLRQAIVSAFRD
jgi:acetylornithine/N-succinyldiaminopimelate aminotransferase